MFSIFGGVVPLKVSDFSGVGDFQLFRSCWVFGLWLKAFFGFRRFQFSASCFAFRPSNFRYRPPTLGFRRPASSLSLSFSLLGSWSVDKLGFQTLRFSEWGVMPRRFLVSWVFGQGCSVKEVFGHCNAFLLVRFGER